VLWSQALGAGNDNWPFEKSDNPGGLLVFHGLNFCLVRTFSTTVFLHSSEPPLEMLNHLLRRFRQIIGFKLVEREQTGLSRLLLTSSASFGGILDIQARVQ
jgi:hypothetical protein